MYDNYLFFTELAEKKKSNFLSQLSLEANKFVLVTIHRDLNTDDFVRLEKILNTLMELAAENSITFVMPFHPRTINILNTKLESLHQDLLKNNHIKMLPPVSFLEMTLLEKYCKLIVTDSGGVQKESHFFRKPCLVLRRESEWIEQVKNGTVKLVDADTYLIKAEFQRFLSNGTALDFPKFYGDGKTAEFILNEIMMMFEKV